MLNVRVNRRLWLRGKRTEKTDSVLRDKRTGQMCCLGFAARAAGLKTKQINALATPHQLFRSMQERGEKFPKELIGLINRNQYPQDSLAARDLMEQNDGVCEFDAKTGNEIPVNAIEREANIAELGRKVGINFSFHG